MIAVSPSIGQTILTITRTIKMTLKFVSAKKPSDHAFRLYEIQQKLRRLEIRRKELEIEERQLERYLQKIGKGQSFVFDGPEYQMVCKISEHTRMILDQEKCRMLLKKRTPYTQSEWTTVKIDYVYNK